MGQLERTMIRSHKAVNCKYSPALEVAVATVNFRSALTPTLIKTLKGCGIGIFALGGVIDKELVRPSSASLKLVAQER